MPRDYAPRGEQRKAVRRNKDASALPGWVWLFAGLSIGMAAAAFYYIGRPMSAKPVAAVESDAAEAKADKTAAGKKKKDVLELPPKEKARFTFYEILPNQEVVIPREALAPKTPGTAAPVLASGELYFIQVASYRDMGEAEKQKATLALLGAEAKIEKVTIDNKATYYRVRLGPEKSLERAQSLMSRLDQNGIQAMLVRVKN